MSIYELREEIMKLQKEINSLPKGSIGRKKINNKYYYYRRYYVGGKRQEKYIKTRKVEKLRSKISYRRELEKKLKEYRLLLKNPENLEATI